jgi:hypothetical protein
VRAISRKNSAILQAMEKSTYFPESKGELKIRIGVIL